MHEVCICRINNNTSHHTQRLAIHTHHSMAHQQPISGLSFPSPATLETGSIDVHDIDTSTPISIHPHVEQRTDSSDTEHTQTQTPTTIRKRKQGDAAPLQSILKNSPNRLSTQHNTSYYSTHSDSQMPPLDPGRAKVLFSPTKEVISYVTDTREQFVVDLSGLEDEQENRTKSIPTRPALIWTDESVPYVLLLYLQLLCNAVLVMVVMYLVFVLIVTIRTDIHHKIASYTSDAVLEISRCTREYYRNKCLPEDGRMRAPALELSCTTWEKCMNRDPQQIGRSRITAETFADIVNGFFRPISWKALVMFCIMLVGSFLVTNVAFGSYRGTRERQLRDKIIQLETRINDQEYRQQILPATPPSQLSHYE